MTRVKRSAKKEEFCGLQNKQLCFLEVAHVKVDLNFSELELQFNNKRVALLRCLIYSLLTYAVVYQI